MKLAALLLLTLTCAACGNPCERELRITENRCEQEVAPGFDTGEQECGGTDEKEARCAIKHKDDYCEWLAALSEGRVVENDYVRCLRE